MKKLFVFLFFTSFTLQAAGPHLCPVLPLEDNGCSFEAVGDEVGEYLGSTSGDLVNFGVKILTGPYASRWKSSCSAHDMCYQTIGKSRKQCDGRFKSNLQSTCGADPFCHSEAELAYLAVRSGGSDNYLEGMEDSLKEIESLYSKVATEDCVSTVKYTKRVDATARNYLRQTFSDMVGRYPTTEEEFKLVDLYELGTSGSKYTDWQSAVDNRINEEFLGTTGPDAVYLLQANTTPFGEIASVTVNGAYSKNKIGYLWHMVHTEYTSPYFTKYTPPAGGMMYFDGYLRVNDSQGKYDYIIIDESFLVNSCTTTICEIEP